jgi:hypothetical protein
MRASLTATTILVALSATAIAGAQGLGVPAEAARAPATMSHVTKARAKSHRRTAQPTHCSTGKGKHKRHASASRRATHHKTVRCFASPVKPGHKHVSKYAPTVSTGAPTVPALASPVGIPPILAVPASSLLTPQPTAPTEPTPSAPGKERTTPKEPKSPGERKETTEPPSEPKEPPVKEPPAKEPPVETEPKEPPPVKTTSRLLGSAALQPSEDTTSGGQAEAFQYEALADGTVRSISLYVNSGDSASTIVVGLYSSVSGAPAHPGKLLTSATIDSPVANAWNSVNVAPVAVEADTTYWLAALAPRGTLAVRDLANGGAPAQSSASESLGTLPSSWSSGATYANSPASFYASGETAGSPPPPQGPTASFTYSPTSPVVGQPVAFNATGSACPDGPCTYEWSNDGGPTQPIPPQIPLGSGQTISLTFLSAGTEYVRLLVTDARGQTATVEHDVTVAPEPPPPPPPTAPSNTAAPTVSGTAQVGQTLTASSGSWSGSTPITYTYQWQREGTDIAGATGSTYKPVVADVEHTLDVLVTAHNSAGTKSVASGPTATVTAAVAKEEPKEEPKKEPPPTEEPSPTQTNCIDKPSSCGYPDATNTGVPAGTTLTPRSGEVSVTAAGTTVKDLAVSGEILVEADNTTLEDDEIIVSAGSGNRGIYIAPGVTGTVIDHDTCHGEGSGTQYCVFNKDSSTKIEASYLYNCGECLNGPGTVTNSFFDVTAVISGEHYEDIYYGGGEGPLIVNHDTMLNPQEQTATIFASNDFGDQTTLTITNNLLAGGGYTLYGGASCTTGECGAVKGPVTVTGNRFSNKYYPESGYYGIGAYFNNAVTTWSGNFWDATLKAVAEPTA